MDKLFNFKKDENGNGILICILVMFIILGVGALVVDTSILYKTKGEMRKAANAAVLSGAQAIFEDTNSVNNIVQYVLEAHNEEYSPPFIEEDKLTVKLNKNVPLYFMKIFGVNSVPIEVTSSAKVGALGGADGVLPIGIPDHAIYQVDHDYSLNYTSGNGDQGNYGYLNFNRVYEPDGTTIVTDSNAPNGEGADALKYFIENGFGPEIGYNYIIYTEPGMNKNKVEQAINTRIGQTVILPIYDHNDQLNGKSYVHIVGFSFFTIKSIGEDNLITGTFIKKVTSGSVNDSAKSSGAYGIKLVE